MPPSIWVTSVTQQPALKNRMITSDQAFQTTPLPFPPEPSQCPPWPDTWSELTNHVSVNSSIVIIRESIEGAPLDLMWLVKFSLDHPQHFSIAGLKAHFPCQGKVHTGTRWENDRGRDHSLRQAAGANEETGGGNKERWGSGQKAYRDEQTSTALLVWRKGTCFSMQLPSPTCAHQKQLNQPRASHYVS